MWWDEQAEAYQREHGGRSSAGPSRVGDSGSCPRASFGFSATWGARTCSSSAAARLSGRSCSRRRAPDLWLSTTRRSWDDGADRLDVTLRRDYFGLHRIELADSPVEFELPYGEWIRLFRASGFAVEELREIRPPEGAMSTYRSEQETAWARSWPMEQIWKVRKPLPT